MTDFAPYQTESPDESRPRPLSPSSYSNRNSTTSPPLKNSFGGYANPWATSSGSGSGSGSGALGSLLPAPVTSGGHSSGFGGLGATGGREYVNQFETSLPIRMDFEAMMAYILLPPAGGVLLLLIEHKSDYVRFHAWQSALLFSALFVVHIIFSFSPFISWFLLCVDLLAIIYLSLHAYRDADTLDRCEVPIFGPLASSILDDE